MKKNNVFDMIIIGGGPAGVTAAIYAKRANMSVILIEKSKIGGQIADTYEILNYPGFEKITGKELSSILEHQLIATGSKIVYDEVQDCDLLGDIKSVKCFKKTYYGSTVIIANGTFVRPLDVTNQNNFIGRGISYSATNDRSKYEGGVVAVVGGGNTALEESLFLSEKAKMVYIIHRRDRYRGQNTLSEQILQKKNIVHLTSSRVVQLVGHEKLESIVIENVNTGEKKSVEIDCLFVAIGRGASTYFVDDVIEKTSDGFIIGNTKMETSIAGVYVAGDVRNTELRQIVSATSDGAVASTSAYNYLMKKRGKSYD